MGPVLASIISTLLTENQSNSRRISLDSLINTNNIDDNQPDIENPILQDQSIKMTVTLHIPTVFKDIR